MKLTVIMIAVVYVLTLTACGEETTSSNNSASASTTYTIGGNVSGLTGTGLVLQNNGGDDVTMDAGGDFTFATEIASGSTYKVTVLTQPSASVAQYCNVIDGKGTASGDVSSITVKCVSGAYNIVETMQSACYNSISGSEAVCGGTGYDADYTGNTTSYTTSADGKVVYDNVTGLAWTQTADITGNGVIDDSDKLTQPSAASYCAGLSYGGHSWRLPSIKELYSLIDFRGTDPSGYLGTDTSVLTPFIDDTVFGVGFGDTSVGDRIIDGQAASSTLYVSPLGTIMGADTMFGVNFIDGRIKGYPYNYPSNNPKTFYVYCVSGNPDYGSNAFINNGDATISDNATGLMWQQGDYHSTSFEDAIAYCESASTATYTDWRLPNVKELQSIVDYTRAPDHTSSASIDALFTTTSFTNEGGANDWGYYWASTTHIGYPAVGDVATYVSFGRALGYFDNGIGLEITDVHGAGAQRSNTKQSHAFDVSSANVGYGLFYYKGPQGDISRYDNRVRCVRDAP